MLINSAGNISLAILHPKHFQKYLHMHCCGFWIINPQRTLKFNDSVNFITFKFFIWWRKEWLYEPDCRVDMLLLIAKFTINKNYQDTEWSWLPEHNPVHRKKYVSMYEQIQVHVFTFHSLYSPEVEITEFCIKCRVLLANAITEGKT